MAEVKFQPDLKHQQGESDLAENDQGHRRNRFEDEGKLVGKEPAEQGRPDDQPTDDFTDHDRLLEQPGHFAANPRDGKNGQ